MDGSEKVFRYTRLSTRSIKRFKIPDAHHHLLHFNNLFKTDEKPTMGALYSFHWFYWTLVFTTAVISAIAEDPGIPSDPNDFTGPEEECETLTCDNGVCNFLDPYHPCECEPGFGGTFCDQICEYLQIGSNCQLWPLNTPVCADKTCSTKGVIDGREYIASSNSIEYTIVWILEDGAESTDIVTISNIPEGSKTLSNYAWNYFNNGCEPTGCQNGGYCVFGLIDPYNFTRNNFTKEYDEEDSIPQWEVNFQCICPSIIQQKVNSVKVRLLVTFHAKVESVHSLEAHNVVNATLTSLGNFVKMNARSIASMVVFASHMRMRRLLYWSRHVCAT